MIDDFKQVPGRQPSRLDSTERFSPVSPDPTVIRPNVVPAPTPAPAVESATATPAATSLSSTEVPFGFSSAATTAAVTSEKSVKGSTVTLFRKWTVSKKKLIIASSLAAVLLIGGGTAFALTRPDATKKAPVAAMAAIVAPPTPAPIVSPLTGVNVTAAQRDLPVVGVMVENSPEARPQSGLRDAGVVFEAIAEAGITRFLALYQEGQPGNIGPVRSARPYYLDWAMGFDAAYAHVGGSPDALQRIKDIGVKDMDQFFNPVAYRRITTRYAPHNMYSSLPQLVDLAKSKGYTTSTYTSLPRKAEKPYVAPAPTPAPTPAPATGAKKTSSPATKPTVTDSRTAANVINLGISSANYNARYDFDATTNSYKRTMAGAPHIDFDSKAQLAPKVVVALAMQYGLMADGYHSAYTTIGSGKMYVFQDGTVTTGTWTKGQPKEQFVFKDDAGKPIELNAGQTWISVVGDPSKVTYQ